MVRSWGAALLFLLAGSTMAPAAPTPRRELTVMAAASLKDVFTELGARFEKANPGVRVALAFAGSQELRTQLEHGAPADVVALADTRHMQALSAAGLPSPSVTFARNRLCVAVPKGNALRLRSLADLPKARRIVVAATEVPAGAYTAQMLAKAGAKLGADFVARVEASIVSRELNVRQVLSKVVLGEADAAVVYESDARSASDKVEAISIPEDLNVVAEYPVAVLKATREPALAQAWVDLLLSPDGQAALARAGFMPRSTTQAL